jgi:hypothetical protein
MTSEGYAYTALLRPEGPQPRVEWREVKGCLGWFFVPKRQEDSEAQGFNPGNRTSPAKSPERAPDRMRQ